MKKMSLKHKIMDKKRAYIHSDETIKRLEKIRSEACSYFEIKDGTEMPPKVYIDQIKFYTQKSRWAVISESEYRPLYELLKEILE